jgi:hypothetical protein
MLHEVTVEVCGWFWPYMVYEAESGPRANVDKRAETLPRTSSVSRARIDRVACAMCAGRAGLVCC